MSLGITWSNKLQCAFHSWEVISDGELALYLPPNNVCDMTGAISIANAIMPSVFRIVVYSGEVEDVEYFTGCGSSKWTAYNLRERMK